MCIGERGGGGVIVAFHDLIVGNGGEKVGNHCAKGSLYELNIYTYYAKERLYK